MSEADNLALFMGIYMNRNINIFNLVKETVNAEQVAAYYGLHINSSHMAICPFHSDKNPSMKIDDRYYCFACGATGDAIDYVSNLFSIGKKDAAIKIASDFGIPINEPLSEDIIKRINEKKASIAAKRNKEYEQNHFYRIVSDYYHLLKQWELLYSPNSFEGDINSLYIEALQKLPFIEYIMDCFLEADFDERDQLINEYKGELNKYEQRISEYT